MAGLEPVQKSLNPEAPEFIPNRNQNIKLIKLPSTISNDDSLYYYCSGPPPVLTFQNPSYNFHDYITTTPASQYLPTYTTTLVPHPSSLYTNPSYPSQPHNCMVGQAEIDPKVGGTKKGCSRRGKRGCRSLWRKYGGRPRVHGCDDSQTKFNIDRSQQCCSRRSSVDLSNNARKQLCKQKHPVVPVQEDGESTTVMIRNIPNRFTREMLMDFLDDHCLVENQKAKQLQNGEHAAAEVEPIVKSAFDFLYLPMDFKTGVNKGYAFVNFTNPKAAWKFYSSAHNLPWGVFQTNKIRQIAVARLQGKEELEWHFENTNFPCEEGKDEYLPVCFSPARDGSRQMVNQRTVGRCTAPPPGAPDQI